MVTAIRMVRAFGIGLLLALQVACGNGEGDRENASTDAKAESSSKDGAENAVSFSSISEHRHSWKDYGQDPSAVGAALLGDSTADQLNSIKSVANALSGESFSRSDVEEFVGHLYSDWSAARSYALGEAEQLSEGAIDAIRPAAMSFVADPVLGVRGGAIQLFLERGGNGEKAMISMLRYSASREVGDLIRDKLGKLDPASQTDWRVDAQQLEGLQWEVGMPKPGSSRSWLDIARSRLLSDAERDRRMQEVRNVLSAGSGQGWKNKELNVYLQHAYSKDWKLRKYAINQMLGMSGERFAAVECVALGAVADPHPEVVVTALEVLTRNRARYWRQWAGVMRYSRISEVSEKAHELLKEGEQ